MRRYLLYLNVIMLCAINGFIPSQTEHLSAPSPRSQTADNIRQFDFQNFTFRTSEEFVQISNGQGVYQGLGNEIFSYDVEKVMVTYGNFEMVK